MSSLSHHGIEGQKWGVRRFQNKDGTLTSAGKKRYSVEAVDVNSSRKEIKKLVGDFSKKDKAFFFGEKHSYGDYDHDSDEVAKRFVIKEGKNIVAFIDAERGDHYSNESLNVVVGTAQSARGKGYASILSKTMVDWYEEEGYKNASMLEWNVNKDNIGSRKAAEKAGFKEVLGDTDVGYRYSKNAKKELDELSKAHMKIKAIDKEVSDKINSDFKKTKLSKLSPNTEITPYGEGQTGWNSELGFYKSMIVDHYATKWAKKNHAEDIARYTKASSDWDSAYSKFDKKRKAKHTSIGGTMYIEGNALILGDSSYLSHHGIRGQRWGVRRFQNRDGSLTNAGRKRLGYATKGAAQAVKKAFNAGVKTGAKAVKAAKAHHEKAEAKKIEKKKEKASKTRAGVSANKDLFTAKELKELNAKFEEQDKLTMARIKHGVEIAKSVGEVAKSAGEVGKAYEALTGHKLVPDIMTLQNGGSIDFNDKDKDKTKDKDKHKDKDSNNNNKDDDDPPKPPNGGGGGGNPPEDNGPGNKPNWTNTPPDLPTPPSKSKWHPPEWREKKNVASVDPLDLQGRMESAKKQASKAMKNAKLQEYIDAYNRDQNSEKNRELTARGQKAIEVLSSGEKFNFEASGSTPAPTPKSAPSSNNLMAQIKAAQAKLEKPNKNETPAEHKEAQEKVNALEKIANEYKAAANKPGADPAEVTEKLLKKNKNILDSIKHMDFNDDAYLEHYGVLGMKWGKHLMAGKGGGIYDGTALGGGGGGGAMTEEERKKAEELRKKKLEEAKKKAEEAAKEKEIEEKAKEIGISAKAYKRYSIDNNHLPRKHHYDKSQKLHNEASSSVAEAQASARQAHMNKAKAASLSRKVNSSHMFDSEGYHISQQRGDDRKEAKRLRKEAKQLDKASKKALKKFYKKRYKADKERQKWQNSTSGKYHHMMRHYEIQNGVLFVDSSDYLAHHGIKGQKWGVRRFQNSDGSLTEKGRKHYEKAIEKLDRKQVNSDSRRGALERQHPFAVTASAILTGSAYAALMVASAANPATIALGTSIVAAVSALGTHVDYSVAEAWEARGTKRRKKKRKEYEEMLNHDGMYHVENGTLFIDAGDPYLEHHGVLGMKWGKHLRASKGPADSAAGGGGEDDEKLKEMAKKAGMSVAEYKQKFASKIGGAASKVGSAVYDAAGGSHKKNAEGWRKMAREESNAARASEKSAHENSSRAASQDRKYGSGGDVYRRAAESDKENAKTHRSNAKGRSERAASEQAAYEKSLAGKYDKMKAGGAKKAVNELSTKVTAAKKRLKDVPVTKDRLKSALGKSKQRKQLTTEGPKAKKQINNARDNVEKAARSNENAYKHAKAVYRQTGSDSDAYKQAIKRSRTTLQRSIDSKKLSKKKKTGQTLRRY